MLTYAQLAKSASPGRQSTSPQLGGGLIDGYALVVGNQTEQLRKLAALLWEYGVPAYAAPNTREPGRTVAAHGAPAFILLQLDKLDAATIVDLETFRMQHDVPLLCVAPAAAQQPHVQALLQMTTDFIVAPYEPDELILRIRRICSTQRATYPVSPAVNATDILSPSETQKSTTPLTESERAIIACLEAKVGEPVSLDELAALVPGKSYEARVRLLRVHIFRLRRKVEPSPRNPIYVRTVRDFGYYLTRKVQNVT